MPRAPRAHLPARRSATSRPSVPAAEKSSTVAASLAAADPTRLAALRRRFPTVADLRIAARRRVPSFGFAYVDGGVGQGDLGAARNASAMDAVELVPRYGGDNRPVA